MVFQSRSARTGGFAVQSAGAAAE
jgi:hypothetical protein